MYHTQPSVSPLSFSWAAEDLLPANLFCCFFLLCIVSMIFYMSIVLRINIPPNFSSNLKLNERSER